MIALQIIIREPSESSYLVSLPIGIGDCVVEGFKMEWKTSLSPSYIPRGDAPKRNKQVYMEGTYQSVYELSSRE